MCVCVRVCTCVCDTYSILLTNHWELGILLNVGKPLTQDATLPGTHSTYNISTHKHTYSKSVNIQFICSVGSVCCQRGAVTENCCHGLGLNLEHPIITGSWILYFSSRPPVPSNCVTQVHVRVHAHTHTSSVHHVHYGCWAGTSRCDHADAGSDLFECWSI